MRVNVEITAANNGQFANVFLCYKEPETEVEKRVQLKVLDFTDLHDFTQDTSSLGFDFFLISAIVYGIDDLFNREKYSFNGWTREFEVQIPVNNLDAWTSRTDNLAEALTFLTGDHWSVTFSYLNVGMYVERANRRVLIPQYNLSDYSFASLFSGGLDSLIGVINELSTISGNNKGVLISHSDGAHPGAKGDQERLLPELSHKFPNRFIRLRSRVGIGNPGHKRESNQRSRSILFLGIGSYIVNNIPDVKTLIIPENGTISLNHPLTVSRISSLSTRTTHPYFIKKIQNLFDLVGLNVLLTNPYSLKTKGEMVSECEDLEFLTAAFNKSVSCGKGGHNSRFPPESRSHKNCGVCMPCIYRRAALHKMGLDNEQFKRDVLIFTDPIKASPDMYALFDYLKSDLPVEKIKKNLLVNGSIQPEDLTGYANVVVRSRVEILSWISDKGSQTLKDALGVR